MGDTVHWNWLASDCPTDTGLVGFYQGVTLPTGLTLDTHGQVSGTTSHTGTWTVTNYFCLSWIAAPIEHYGKNVTITVSDAPITASQTPTLSVADGADDYCSLVIVGSIPESSDPGSVLLHLSNGTNSYDLHMADMSAGDTFSLLLSMNNLEDSIGQLNSVTSSFATGPFQCGDSIDTTLSYNAVGETTASTDVTGVTPTLVTSNPPPAPETPTLDLTAAMVPSEGYCTVMVHYTVHEAPDSGNVSLQASNGPNTVSFSMLDYSPGSELEVRLPLGDMASLANNYTNYQESETPSGFACGDTVTVTVSYSSQGVSGSATSAPVVTPEIVQNPTSTVTATALDDQNCSIRVDIDYSALPNTGQIELQLTDPVTYASFILDYDVSTPGTTLSKVISLRHPDLVEHDSDVSSHFMSDPPITCGSQLNVGAWYQYEVNIVRSSAVQVTPTRGFGAPVRLTATPLYDENCSFRVVGTLPTNVDSGSLHLTMTSQSGNFDIGLRDYSAGSLIDLTLSITNWDPFGNDNVLTYTSSLAPAPSCGQTQTVSMIYMINSISGTLGSVDVLPDWALLDATPSVTASQVDGNNCLLRADVFVPDTDEGSTISVSIFNDDTNVTYDLARADSDIHFYTLTANLYDFADAVTNTEVSNLIHTGDAPNCSDTTYHVNVETTYHEREFFALPQTVMMTERHINGVWDSPSFQANLTPLGGEKCLVAASVTIPREVESASLLIGTLDQGGPYIELPLASYTPGVPFVIAVPLSDLASLQSPYQGGEVTTHYGTVHCGQQILGNVQISYQGFTTTAGTGTVLPFAECNYGKYLDDGECVPAEVGYYVGGSGAEAETACPAGYSTEGIGSVSVFQCYRVIAQTVTGLKPPKALKFKKVIGLPVKTTAGVNAAVTATGPCTIRLVDPGVKVAGKKVKVRTLVVTAGSVAGVCVLAYSSPIHGHYGTLTKSVSIKVSKTGK